MAKSIVQKSKFCYLCFTERDLQCHHIFGGPNRHLADEDGLTCWLCERCHRRLHDKNEGMAFLHAVGQRQYEKNIGTREDFMKRYGRNYL